MLMVIIFLGKLVHQPVLIQGAKAVRAAPDHYISRGKRLFNFFFLLLGAAFRFYTSSVQKYMEHLTMMRKKSVSWLNQ